MTTAVKSCGPYDTLNRAAQIMWENDCGAVPVVDHDTRVVGMITDRDLCMAAYTQGVLLNHSQVNGAMSKDIIVCGPAQDIATAEKLMREHQVRRLPVVDDKERLVGILSLNDIARYADRERASKARKRQIKDTEVVQTLGAICVPNGSGTAVHAA